MRVNEIKAISNPHQKAVDWLINSIMLSSKSPQNIKELFSKGEDLWPNHYALKEAILLLNSAEIDNSENKNVAAYHQAQNAVQLIIANSSSSVYEIQILSLAYSILGKLSLYTKEKESGLDYCFKALELASAINFLEGMALAQNQIGLIIYYGENDCDLALTHFIKSKEIISKLSSPFKDFLSPYALNNIALMEAKMGQFEKSINYHLETLKQEGLEENIELNIITNNNIGTYYYKLKKYDLAETYLKNALALMTDHEITKNKGIPLLRMGLIQLEKGNPNKAILFADAIDFWLINHQFISDHLVTFHQFKSTIAKVQQDLEQAVFWLEKAAKEQKMLDSLINSKKLIKLEEQNIFHEINQEIILLEKEIKLNQATINFQKLLLLGIGLVTVLSIWFGITFYEKNKEITEAYDYILNQSKEKKKPNKLEQKIVSQQKSNPVKHIDEVLKQKIVYALVNNKSFLSPDLTLKKFADIVESNTSYVSQTINDGFGKNFNALINEYRVEEVLRLFQEGQHQIFTIESIYQKAGFKSKSSFQKAFKTKTGVTATHYLNHIS